jgi:serine phosphatase RsbU (regulator of sigma subunit)
MGRFSGIQARPGEIHKFPAHDVPLGILPKLTVESSQVLTLQEGDLVLLITDGFLEWENNNGEQFGNARFEQTL